VLFRPLGVEIVSEVRDIPLLRLSLFTILPGERLEAARWLAIVILAAVISGWRPRITGILHWWVTASFAVSCVIVEGGDQAAAILTIAGPGRAIAASVAVSALNVVRLQMAVIYFFACTAKLGVAEWSNGTAAYYWFLHPIFGVEGWRRALLMPALTGPVGVTLLTWGSVALEALLFMGLLMERRWRPWLFAAGVLFHCGIAVIHGLPTFGMVMIAGLILYLLPHERPLTLEPLQRAPTVCTDAGCGRIGSPQVAR
jgi:hypothetical protein